jgi:hypothetical protein
MRSTRTGRLRVVVPALAVGGALAVANAVGHGWGAAVAVAVIMIPVAIVNYVQAGGDSDRAAMMIGGRADERQALIRTRAMALSGVVIYVAALISGIVMIALRGIGQWSNYWPIGLVVAVGTVTYVWGGHAGGYGGRADERQVLIRMRARAWSGYAMAAAAVIGALVEVGLGDTFGSYWPLGLIVVAGAAGYLAGEAKYGSAHGADYAPGAGTAEGEPAGRNADRVDCGRNDGAC